MTTQETSGKIKKIKGRAKEAAGIITGNKDLEKKGSHQRTEGKVEEGLGKARRKISDAIEAVADSVRKSD
jgi:uncharacterized protein YjbJ (UPF0337 family)